MRKTKLPAREVEVCLRFREAREKLELDQAGCARQIGIERSTLLNYEHCRTPLRFEVALKFCRQFIVSEEWLATGEHFSCHKAAPGRGVILGQDVKLIDDQIFFRQCEDLLSEPATLHLPHGILFTEAFDSVLNTHYSRLVEHFFWLPRIVLSDSDNAQLVCNLLNAINKRFVILLNNEALRRQQKGSSAWRVYARCVLESTDLIFRKMMRFNLNSDLIGQLDWLKKCVTNPDAIIPFLDESQTLQTSPSEKYNLTDKATLNKTVDVKPKLPSLLERLNRATRESGKMSELADWLGVPLASVSRWLAGKREPSGEITLRMLHWVEQQERQK